MHSYNVSGHLKSFTLFPKLHCSRNLSVISKKPLHQMLLGDLSCSYHGSQITRDFAVHVIKHYRFQQLEKWLKHQPDIQKNHADFMTEYKEPGHMQLVSGDHGKVTSYLPHHLIFKHNSSTTKFKESLM